MTSNLGAKLIAGSGKSIGFSGDGSATLSDEKIREAVLGELKQAFRPEFLNRVDEIIVFNQLTKPEIGEIARRMLDQTKERLQSMDITMDFSQAVIDMVADEGFDPVYGARPLRRAIQSKIEDRLSEQILEGAIAAGRQYTCELENGEAVFKEQSTVDSQQSSARDDTQA